MTSPLIGATGSAVRAPETTEATEVSRTVFLHDYYFQPATIEVPRGARVVLTVVNRGNHEHAWVLMEKDFVWEHPFDAEDSNHGLTRVTVDVIGRDTLVFTAPSEPGEYNIVCSILGHVEFGMVGTLIVV